MNTQQNLYTYLHFLGHGNPDNKIWFIGIEEGGDMSCTPKTGQLVKVKNLNLVPERDYHETSKI